MLLLSIAVILVCCVLVVLSGYNKLRALSEGVKEAWSNIGVILRKQNSLVSQLIDVTKGYQESEKLIMLKISEDASTAVLSQAHQQKGTVLATVAGMAQKYPDLKSNEQYNSLMASLNKLEDELSAQRGQYNSAAKKYNVIRTTVPHVFYSASLGFNVAPYLNIDASEPQEIENLTASISDDGERLNALLAGASDKMINVGKDMSHKAIETGKVVVDKAQGQIKQIKKNDDL